MDGSGDAVVVWTGQFGNDSIVGVSRYTAATSSWSAPSTSARQANRGAGSRVAMDPDGNAVVVWVRSKRRVRCHRAGSVLFGRDSHFGRPSPTSVPLDS